MEIKSVESACPYCPALYKGPIGYYNLRRHIENNHPEKSLEFKKMPKKRVERIHMKGQETQKVFIQQNQPATPQIIMQHPAQESNQQPMNPNIQTIPMFQESAPVELEEVPLPLRETPMVPIQQIKQQPIQQPQQQTIQPMFQPLQQVPKQPETKEEKHLPPYLDQLPPHEWLQQFLEYYDCDQLFIKIQVDNVLLTKELPTTATLMNDLKQMKSGHSHLTMIQYIGNMYEHMLRAYLKKQEEIMYSPRTGIPLGSSLSHRGGIPIFNEQRTDPYNPPVRPAYADDSRIARLEDELRQRQQQDQRNMENKIQELTMKLEQSKTVQEDPRMRELQEEMKRIMEGNRLLQQQLEQQREENLRREIQDIKNLALANRFSPEQISQMVDQRVREERNTIDARHEIEQLLETKLSARAGVTQADVDLKKAELDLELGKDKIKAETDKWGMIGETAKDVAGLFGEGLGRGLSQKQTPSMPTQRQQTQEPTLQTQEQLIRPCPYGCKTQLLIEPGTRYGTCPGCNRSIEIDEYGMPHIFQEPPPPTRQPPQTEQQKTPQHNDTPSEPQGTISVEIQPPEIPEPEPYIGHGRKPIIDYTLALDKKETPSEKQKTKKEQ